MLSFLFTYVNLPKGELFVNLCVSTLIDWGRVTHICVGNLAIIGSDNCLSPGRRHAIIWTDAGILLIGPSETDFNEIVIKIHTFSFKKIYLKMSPDSKVHEANMGPIWGQQDPGGPQVSPMNFAIWVVRKMVAICLGLHVLTFKAKLCIHTSLVYGIYLDNSVYYMRHQAII